MKYIYHRLKKWKLKVFCAVLYLTLCSIYASGILSIEELKNPNTYKSSNFAKVLHSARKSPKLFTSPYKGAPFIFHIIGSGVLLATQAKELIGIILETSTQINRIQAIDGKSMLHAIALCSTKYPDYIKEMFCFLLEKGIDFKMKDKAGYTAEEYLSLKSSKLYLLVKKAIMSNQTSVAPIDTTNNEELKSIEKSDSITSEEVVQALMQAFRGEKKGS